MVKKIAKILSPIDGSPNSIRGLQNALTLAKPHNAEVTGLFIINIPATAAIKFTPQMRKKEIKYAESILRDATKLALKNGVAFKPKVETGDPKAKIVKIANSDQYDLIVIGSRGRGAVKEMFLGSTSNHVLHKVKKPVIIVK